MERLIELMQFESMSCFNEDVSIHELFNKGGIDGLQINKLLDAEECERGERMDKELLWG